MESNKQFSWWLKRAVWLMDSKEQFGWRTTQKSSLVDHSKEQFSCWLKRAVQLTEASLLELSFFLNNLFSTSLPLVGNSSHLTQVRRSCCKSSVTHSYQCMPYFCVVSKQGWGCQSLVFFYMRTDVDACHCTLGLYKYWKRVCAGSWLWEKNPLPHQGLEPVSALLLAFRLDAQPIELFPVADLDVTCEVLQGIGENNNSLLTTTLDKIP